MNSFMGPSYKVQLINPNYINPDSNKGEGDKIVAEVTAKSCQGYNCYYSYRPNYICINRKTAIVNYRDKECNNDEITIADGKSSGIDYWKYFVPLDAKNGDSFGISLAYKQEAGVKKKEFCLALINKYPKSYTSYIKDKDGNDLSSSAAVAKSQVDGGCRLMSEIKIPITQKFYNEKEENGTKKLNGYAFYYRPIDVNNPFPNGITDESSYWYDWYKSNKKDPNLADSFKTITYAANNIKTSSIRAYNENNPYTSWQGMKVDGSSEFVKSYLTSNGKQDFYKLGCGPANKDWEECK